MPEIVDHEQDVIQGRALRTFKEEQLIELRRLKSRLPDFVVAQLPDQLYPSVDLFATTKKYNIRVWEFGKIKKLLQKIYSAHGMRVKFKKYDTFLWGMALSVFDNHVINVYKTRYDWDEDPRHRWRWVWIYPIPNDAAEPFINGIPFGLGNIIATFAASGLQKKISVYDNFAYKNTMASEVIICNWDVILKDLNKNGY